MTAPPLWATELATRLGTDVVTDRDALMSVERDQAPLAPGGSAAAIRPRSDDEAVRWVRDVARGVHDAHLRNVFHRALKPHNVLITPFSRRARIADFGLAVSDGHDTSGASGTIDDTRDRAPQIDLGHLAQVDAVQPHRARGRVVEP